MNSTIGNICRTIVIACALLGPGFGSASFGNATGNVGCSWRRTDGSIALVRSEHVLWQLNYNKQEGQPYFHPLALADGTVLTSLRPADHPWHKALWFSWKYINGVNYWDPVPPEGRTEVVDVNARTGTNYSARVEMKISYHPHQKPAVLTEKRALAVSAPDEDGCYYIDWLSIFTAGANDVLLDRTPIPGEQNGKSYGGYAGLSLRMADRAKDWRFLGSEGPAEPESRGIKAHWMDFAGKVGEGTLAGVTIFDHPDNPRHPSSWWLSTSMPYFSPALLFDGPHTLHAGKTLTLRYRILVHAGRPEKDILESRWREFLGPKSRK
jgi:hypothetical protein